jgi:hypothetical protein
MSTEEYGLQIVLTKVPVKIHIQVQGWMQINGGARVAVVQSCAPGGQDCLLRNRVGPAAGGIAEYSWTLEAADAV